MNQAMRFTKVCACQITGICAINTPKKHVLNCFAAGMAAIIVARRRHASQGRGFCSTHINLFGMPEEHMMRTYRLASHVIFNLLQELKDNLEPSTRSHAIPGLSKRLATLYLLASGPFQLTVAYLFLYSLFATKLICAVLGILRRSIWK